MRIIPIMPKVKMMAGIASISGKFGNKELAERLEAYVACAAGSMAGLNILLYGWKKFRKYGAKYLDALKHREWLYIKEVMDLSEYAGYDLTKREQNPLCEGK